MAWQNRNKKQKKVSLTFSSAQKANFNLLSERQANNLNYATSYMQ